MTKKFPWFKFHPSEYMSGDIMYCSDATQGIFVRIMCTCWQRGELPKDPRFLSRIINSTEESIGNALAELEQFKIIQDTQDGRFTLRFMREQLEEMEDAQEVRSDAGRKGMKVRWHK